MNSQEHNPQKLLHFASYFANFFFHHWKKITFGCIIYIGRFVHFLSPVVRPGENVPFVCFFQYLN